MSSFRAPNLVATPRRTRVRTPNNATTSATILLPVCQTLGLVRIFRRVGLLPPKTKSTPRAISRHRVPPKRSVLKHESKYTAPDKVGEIKTIVQPASTHERLLSEFSYSYFPRSNLLRKVTNAVGLAEPQLIQCVKGRYFEVVAPEEFAPAPLACEVELDTDSGSESDESSESESDGEGVVRVLRFDLPADSPKVALDDVATEEDEEEMEYPSWMEFIRVRRFILAIPLPC
ncbi:hypothetical protein FB45DRAFT_873175 [Roridomyces roridus]|uniref:Uncharacterized protein n=1 Tax=Roridomyces roridus TaxID=1738132 RepID=A0AAD7BB61_9AGAR|nr:hypothetical protein FB45DRAFT_873175 [Roridomyces roridus]